MYKMSYPGRVNESHFSAISPTLPVRSLSGTKTLLSDTPLPFIFPDFPVPLKISQMECQTPFYSFFSRTCRNSQVWVVVQLIHRPTWAKHQPYKNPNIAKLGNVYILYSLVFQHRNPRCTFLSESP